MAKKKAVTFNLKSVTKHLVSVLGERARDVVTRRYGLLDSSDRMTLEAIGKKYDITRERVRQIENHSLALIRKSKEYEKEGPAFNELHKLIHSLGCLVAEDELLSFVTSEKNLQNHVHFMLVVGDSFIKEKEDDNFKHRWCVDEDLSKKIQGSIEKVYNALSDHDLVSEPDMIKTFFAHLVDVADDLKTEEIAKRWLSVSKKIGRNPLGEWGKSHSTNVNAKGMRDYAYLVIRKHGSPIHFREVAKAIEKMFGRKAHIATTHNELIKDKRFVLVGRGLYALSEWGYMSGVVKDVIKNILEKEGALPKDKIIEKVLKERYVKENTILVNLQNQKYFKKNKEGLFEIAK